jgi:hypothetical protein
MLASKMLFVFCFLPDGRQLWGHCMYTLHKLLSEDQLAIFLFPYAVRQPSGACSAPMTGNRELRSTCS